VALSLALLGGVALTSCSRGEPRYRAEKMLFEANKMNAELSQTLNRPSGEFLDRTLSAYRKIVEEFSPKMHEEEGLEKLVISAQIALGELEFRAGRLAQARDDFVHVLDLERNEPGARMNAIYSAGVLSELMRDPEGAIEYYEDFFNDYLSVEQAPATSREQMRYLVTPLKLAELSKATGNEHSAALWLMRAEALYTGLIDSGVQGELLMNANFNLLTALIQQEKWDEADKLAEAIARNYRQPISAASIDFLRARIREHGFGDHEGALAFYKSVWADHPHSADAPKAMLAAAAIQLRLEKPDAARELYERVADDYAGDAAAAGEAEWQLAQMAVENKDWAEASLRYRSILASYPRTSYAYEAPIQLALGYRRLGEEDNATNWFDRALGGYREIIDDRNASLPEKVTAEEYILQVYTLQKRWKEAVKHLTGMPERYPDFASLRQNYLTAAEIYEKELDDVPAAIDCLEECRRRYPDSSAAKTAEAELQRLRDLE